MLLAMTECNHLVYCTFFPATGGHPALGPGAPLHSPWQSFPLLLVARLRPEALSLRRVRADGRSITPWSLSPMRRRTKRGGKCMLQKQRTVNPQVALHRIPPPKESMKRFVENHRLRRA